LRVLIGCEFSGTVRDAFIARGHDAISCDLLPTEKPGPHIQGDLLTILDDGWDLAIFHPPCTDLAVSGAAWFATKRADGRQQRALDFVQALLDAPIPLIALENPVGVISSAIRKPDQIVQPWMFGHAERKTTCLWLKGLPKVVPTSNLKAECDAKPANKQNPLHYLPPSPDRWAKRSLTYPGLATAIADQWGAQPNPTPSTAPPPTLTLRRLQPPPTAQPPAGATVLVDALGAPVWIMLPPDQQSPRP